MLNLDFFDKFPELQSERLVFREFTREDAEEIQLIRSNKEVMRFLDNENHDSIEKSEEFISNNLSAYQNKKGLFWAIIEKSSGEFIGDFSFWRLDFKNHRAEIGYTLKPNYWGNGFMTETIECILDFGFNSFHLHSVEANINPANENSRKLLLKTGFQKEAYFRENYFFNGEYLDSEIYAILANDFNKRHR